MTLLADQFGAPELDVHGYDAHGAVYEAEAFCERAWAKGVPAVKVVHGRGQGKLRVALLAWARRSGLRAEDSTLVGETGAVLYVSLV